MSSRAAIFVILRDVVSFVQKRKVTLSEDGRAMLEKTLEQMKSLIFSFNGIEGGGSDIAVI